MKKIFTRNPDQRSNCKPEVSHVPETLTLDVDIGDEAPRYRQEGVDACAGSEVDGGEIERLQLVFEQKKRRVQDLRLQVWLTKDEEIEL